MKKIICLLAAAVCLSQSTMAATGDTTWIQANVNNLDGYGNYDNVVHFPLTPGASYRKIYMIFTLGKHTCPGYTYGTGAVPWCGDWDYTVQNYLIVPSGSYEIGRFITPYANDGAPRTPYTWKQHYVYDVTDYAPLMKDSATMRIAYSGYSGGFTADIKFMFIEGTPDRDVVGIERIWGGSYGYGDTSHHGANFINVHFPPKYRTAPVYTKSAALKFTVTGHGSDGNGCCEFMSHNYQVLFNGSTIADQVIWRNDCGRNELYPQSGTWVFERGNWCPGASVRDNYHILPGIVAGGNFTVGLQFDPYVGGGSYTTEGTLFYYGAMKKNLDASIDDIIAPTNDENHFRENPICGSPVVHVKNRGKSRIDSITIRYGLKDSSWHTFTWVGTLNTFEEKDITLPALNELNSIAGDTLLHSFTANIQLVNGIPDADAMNNTMTSHFYAAAFWPSSFKVVFKTNNEAKVTGSTISETSWAIYDRDNNIVAARNNAALSTIFTDTVKLRTGFYKFVIFDSSCDGLQWWLFPQIGVTSGYLNVRKLTTNVNIPMKGYNYSTGYNNDFGCGFTAYFYAVDSAHLGISNLTETSAAMDVYPNPAANNVNVEFSGMEHVNGELQIIDALGRVVVQNKCSGLHQQLNTDALSNGVYVVLFLNSETGEKLTSKLLIAK